MKQKRKQYPGSRSESHYIPGDVVITRAEEGAEDKFVRFSVSASSEHPVERIGFLGRWREVLDHSPSAVQMGRFTSGRAAVLEEHRGAPVGVIDEARLDAGKLRVDGHFGRSNRANEVAQDYLDNIRTSTSIGYIPKRAKLIEENEELGDLWRVTLWEPVELSFVGVPADPTVGAGRNGEGGPYPSIIIEGDEPEEVRTMKRVRGDGGIVLEVPDDDPRPAINAEREQSEADALRRRNVSDLGEQFGYDFKVIRGWLENPEMTVEKVQRAILTDRATDPNARASASAEDIVTAGLPAEDLKRYSYCRAILLAAGMRDGKAPDGVEGDVHRWLRKRTPVVGEDRGGILLPFSRSVAARALDSKTAGKGAELVQDQRGELIELLRNRSALLRLGAQSLSGLTAPVSFPKQSLPTTAYWVSENPPTDVTASDVTLAIAQLTPKTLQVTSAWSRQLLMTGTPDAENLVVNDFARVHALAIDLAGIHGLGAQGEPVGIYKAVGVSAPTVSGAGFDYAKVLTMQGAVANLNADFGSLGWLTNPTLATNLKGKSRFANTDTPVWEGTYEDGRVGGYRAVATNQVSKVMTGSERIGGNEIGAIFGNWADLIFGFWGGLEVIIDPYALKKRGMYEGTSFQLADTLTRHGESFAKATGVTS